MGNWCGDYQWVKGTPQKTKEGNNFFILSDPYGKKIVIEQHLNGTFEKLIYDSALLDYRKLNPRDKLGWLREDLGNDRFLIRDREHTPVLIEQQTYIEDRPRECHYYSPHLFYLGHQKIFYEDLGDPFNGVVLYDVLGHAVLKKQYSVLPDGTFDEVLVDSQS